MSPIIQLHPNDDLAVALQPLAAGIRVSMGRQEVETVAPIPQKQKLLLRTIAAGEMVTMYGVPVGKLVRSLPAGALLRKEDINHAAAPFSTRAKKTYQWQAPATGRFAQATFNGYLRSDGKVGTRNYWLVVPLVFCENQNVDTLKGAFEKALGYATESSAEQRVKQLLQHQLSGGSADDFVFAPLQTTAAQRPFAHVDGIRFLIHNGGCGGSRDDARMLCKLLAGYINHPNVGGATVLSLGCQNATITWLKEALQDIAPDFDKPLVMLEQQQAGSNEALLQQAIDQTFWGLAAINKVERSAQPISKLVLGLKCGGSDGFSGISANPALGHASDLLVSCGGSSILAEFPELCGVEQSLIDRCTTTESAAKFETLMRDYAALSEQFGNPFHMNPSEGNIRDGLLTDAMKSAGAARKGGNAPVSGVLNYAEQISTPGLQLLCTPGNDVEATTGIAGSGATVTVFTTGLGTPTGNPVSPMIKISTNSELFHRMPDVIDFDCGAIITGAQTIEQCGAALLEQIIRTASGEATKAEQLQQNDFIPWRKSISV
jgi:altronate hydrolase